MAIQSIMLGMLNPSTSPGASDFPFVSYLGKTALAVLPDTSYGNENKEMS